MEGRIHIPTVTDLHRLAGVPGPQHPLLAITRIEDVPVLSEAYPAIMTYGFYSIAMKHNLGSCLHYGRGQYDFQEGVMGYTAPHQMISFDHGEARDVSGWVLYFHPELLAGHPLAEAIHKYGFFTYQVNEALHLSQKEEASLETIFENIQTEYLHPIDTHSKHVVLSNLELLLTYSNRYYARQFVTRKAPNSSLLERFELALREHFKTEGELKRIPKVSDFAELLHVSPNYLSDTLRSLTGKNTQEHIHFNLLEKAKAILLASDKTISQIAFELGFEYPQYFSRLFKEKTGFSPSQFRHQA